MNHALALPMLVLLAACGDGTATERYLIDPPDAQRQATNRLGPTELRRVSLPAYASGEEVAFQTADGAVRSNTEVLWADQPERAVTLSLARLISDMSGATVIGEPWPLASAPRHRLDVRVEQALAGSDGIFRFTGRYFLSDEDLAGPNHARGFAFRVPVDPESPASIAQAWSSSITLLAEQISVIGGPGSSVASRAPAMDYPMLPPL